MALGMVGALLVGLGAVVGISIEMTHEAERAQRRVETTEVLKLASLLEFEAAFGYEGVIHSLKNYVLRADPDDRALTEASLDDARAALNRYTSVGGITPEEGEHLDKLHALIDAYRGALDAIGVHGVSIAEADRLARVDDTRYVDSIGALRDLGSARSAYVLEQLQSSMSAARARIIVLGIVTASATVAICVILVLQAARRVRSAYARAEAAARAKTDFLANMSHEIRTPMTAILGHAELLAEDGNLDEAPPQRVESIMTIRRNGEHLLEVINDILDVTKVESGHMSSECIETDPAKIVGEAVNLMSSRAIGKGIGLGCVFETPIPASIQTDPTRLRQILFNLIGNAIKFTERGGVTVRVGCDPDARSMRFAIADTGIGMAREQRDAVARFEAFAQADTSTTREYGGTGLGLRISSALAEMLGGRIEVDSTLGRGSVFTLVVATGNLHGIAMITPDRVPAFVEDRAPAAPEPEHVQAARPLDGVRVLLAEDGPDNQRLISFHLRKAGAEVRVCENGRVALDAIETSGEAERPHVILIDMQMPELDGYGATQQLRRSGCTIPIIALTAHAMDGDRQKCLDAGCDDYSTKPIDREELIGKCAAWAARGRSAARAA